MCVCVSVLNDTLVNDGDRDMFVMLLFMDILIYDHFIFHLLL